MGATTTLTSSLHHHELIGLLLPCMFEVNMGDATAKTEKTWATSLALAAHIL